MSNELDNIASQLGREYGKLFIEGLNKALNSPDTPEEPSKE